MRRHLPAVLALVVGVAVGYVVASGGRSGPGGSAPAHSHAAPFEVHESAWTVPSTSFVRYRPFRVRERGVVTEIGPAPSEGTPTLTLILANGELWITAVRED
jgi:hypothetical protein